MAVEINLENKTALVTGGTRGIGKAIVDELLQSGAMVFATGTNVAQIKELNTTNKNSQLTYLQLNLSNPDNVKDFIAKTLELTDVDILINNAGINIVSGADKTTDESFLKIQEVNVHGPFLLAQAFGKQMVKRNWGRIVNVASIWGVVTRPGRLSYSASKMALLGINKTLAVEWAKNNVLVNAVSPGFTLTELTIATNTKEELNIIKNKIPQNRLALPEEIARGVLFLSSNLNSYIVGQNLIIDGGYTTI
ncbi:SDR family oxidoreductase [Flavobacteriaceae bacterium]|nr:SDR family oxidoreductase [Flavobacteriaceae bacterium]